MRFVLEPLVMHVDENIDTWWNTKDSLKKKTSAGIHPTLLNRHFAKRQWRAHGGNHTIQVAPVDAESNLGNLGSEPVQPQSALQTTVAILQLQSFGPETRGNNLISKRELSQYSFRCSAHCEVVAMSHYSLLSLMWAWTLNLSLF